MNPHLLAYLCFFTFVGSVIAAFMGVLSWGGLGIVFVGTFIAAIINGLLIGSRLKN